MSKPLQFQENGADKLLEILKDNRSAFLADEVGLGKTYTSTLLIRKMAEQKWEAQGQNQETPFRVLYVGPSKALVQKNCSDMIKKYNTTEETMKPPLINLNEYKEDEEVFSIVKAYIDSKEKDINENKRKEIIQNFIKQYKRLYPLISADIKNRQNVRKATINQAWKDTYNNCWKNYAGFKPTILTVDDIYGRAGMSSLNGQAKVAPDRLLLLNTKDLTKKSVREIQLASSSIQLMGKQATRNAAEIEMVEEVLKNHGKKLEDYSYDDKKKLCWETIEPQFFEKFDLVIFDEYHRYFESVDFSDDGCRIHESLRGAATPEGKAIPQFLFVSATPYKVGKIAGDENSDYADESLKKLPTFENFAKLVYQDDTAEKPGKDELVKKLVKANQEYTDAINQLLAAEEKDSDEYKALAEDTKNKKNTLQGLLQSRMVRHERTLLSNTKKQEGQIDLSEVDNIQNLVEPLKNMYRERALLKKYGYQGNALRWGLSMPYLLSFSTRYGIAAKKEESTEQTSTKQDIYFEDLKPRRNEDLLNNKDVLKPLFMPETETELLDLPNKNLVFYHICNNQTSEKQRLRIWMPPTKPTIENEGEDKEDKSKDDSKLIVFAEAACMQRGAALLVSRYADALNKRDIDRWRDEDKAQNKNTLCVAQEVIKEGFHFSENENNLINNWMSTDPQIAEKIAATPYYCAERLNDNYKSKIAPDKMIDPKEMEDAFNCYFKRPEVKNALLAWMYQRKESFAKDDFRTALQTYCYEENLYAVLEEWLFCRDYDITSEVLNTVLKKEGTQEVISPLSYGTDDQCPERYRDQHLV